MYIIHKPNTGVGVPHSGGGQISPGGVTALPVFWDWKVKKLGLADRLLLVKCYDKKWFKSPFNCVIFPLTHPQVANQQQQHQKKESK